MFLFDCSVFVCDNISNTEFSSPPASIRTSLSGSDLISLSLFSTSSACSTPNHSAKYQNTTYNWSIKVSSVIYIANISKNKYLHPIGITFFDNVLATTNLTFGTLSVDNFNKLGNISWENLSPLMALLDINLAHTKANVCLLIHFFAYTRENLSS